MRILSSFIYFFCILVFTNVSCSNTPKNSEATSYENSSQESIDTEPQDLHIKVTDRTIFYDQNIPSATAFIVISKKYTDLSVYVPIDKDTVLVARYPVCLSRKLGQKEKNGDMKTPECSMEKPFTITQILNSSDWHHDFGDGRGSIKAYGNWFLRLSTPPHSGIGIHGSTNNESSVPGRDSEGCIRMRDADIIHLKENYAYKGMKVVVTQEEQDMLPFEKNIVVKYRDGIPEIKKESGKEEIIEKKEEILIDETLTVKKEDTQLVIDNGNAQYHVVKNGETLSGIANKYRTTRQKLQELNSINNPDKINAGDKIRVK